MKICDRYNAEITRKGKVVDSINCTTMKLHIKPQARCEGKTLYDRKITINHCEIQNLLIDVDTDTILYIDHCTIDGINIKGECICDIHSTNSDITRITNNLDHFLEGRTSVLYLRNSYLTHLMGAYRYVDIENSCIESSNTCLIEGIYQDMRSHIYKYGAVYLYNDDTFNQNHTIPVALEQCNEGIYVYKSFNTYYRPNPNWTIQEGITIREHSLNRNVDDSCGAGINVCASMADAIWMTKNNKRTKDTPVHIYRLLIPWAWIGGIVFPSFHSDYDVYKFRCNQAIIKEIVHTIPAVEG